MSLWGVPSSDRAKNSTHAKLAQREISTVATKVNSPVIITHFQSACVCVRYVLYVKLRFPVTLTTIHQRWRTKVIFTEHTLMKTRDKKAKQHKRMTTAATGIELSQLEYSSFRSLVIATISTYSTQNLCIFVARNETCYFLYSHTALRFASTIYGIAWRKAHTPHRIRSTLSRKYLLLCFILHADSMIFTLTQQGLRYFKSVPM